MTSLGGGVILSLYFGNWGEYLDDSRSQENLPVETDESSESPAKKQPEIVYTTTDEGKVVAYNLVTGDIVWEEETLEEATLALARQGGTILDHSGRVPWTYSPMFGDLICGKMLEGRTLSEVCKLQGMPPRATVMRWRSMHPGFDEQVQMAQRMAAEHWHDEVAESVPKEEDIGKEAVPAAKLAFDKRKWLAEKNDPDRYGPRTKVSGDDSQPITVVVDTGIDRSQRKKRRDLS